MNRLHKAVSSRERAAALIIVLAFVVLLTGVAIAYLSRTTSDRRIAQSSFHQSNVDQLAQSAMDNIIGDLRQEIANGSISPTPTPPTGAQYIPTSVANMVPMRNPTPTPGTTPAISNLIRRSVRSDPVPPTLWPDPVNGPAVGSRASGVNSFSDVSANGRSVSLSRWNSHYLVPKRDPGTGDSIPIDAFADVTPDWVFVAPNPNDPGQEWRKVITAPDQTVIGRYAYAIFDEGGLLDMNAAGYPSPTTILQYGRKGSLAFADLTALGGFTTTSTDNVVGWRNYASSRPSNTLTSNFNFSTNATNTYYNFILSDPNSIQLTNYFTGSPITYFTNSFLTTSQAPGFNGQTDQALTTRQELIKLRSGVSGAGISFSNALQYLSTFSREALGKVPQWSPTAPDSINPNFQTLLVTNSFTRNDGTTANVGDYLVNERFLLQRLNWLTYKGPSGPNPDNPSGRNIPTSAPSLSGCIPVSATCAPDYDMWLLTRSNGITFGLTRNFLLQGSSANIIKYFGLAWDGTNERWNYVGHSGSTVPIDSIATLGSLTGTREPDFFELLQAGVFNNSLGDSAASYPELPITHQQSKMLHILTIGANLIAQTRADSYPVRVACNVGGTIMEAVGVPRLPLISSLAACPVGVTDPSGGMNWLLVPNLWDPFRDTWDLTEEHASNDDNPNHQDNIWLTPGYLRPPVRIMLKGTGTGGSTSVGFGAASTVSSSGRVAPVSAFSTLPVNSSSLVLQTGNLTSRGGRDGFLQAMRMGVTDFVTTPASFNPTTLGGAPSWSRVAPPANDSSTRTDDYAVFRLSANIPAGTAGYPVLILNPGFQITMDYQSPNGQWYPYSFLQGNSATNTWISSPLSIATNYSQYGGPPSALTIVKSGTSNPTRWDQVTTGGVAALAQAPMFAKADPRSIRYNSQIGTLTLTGNSAGVIGSIWPNAYTSPPAFPPGASPAAYSQTTGDNAPAAGAGANSNPYGEANGDAVRPVMMNRPFRSVGEMSYAFRDQPFRTLTFSWAPITPNPDAGLLDLFTTNNYSDPSGMRGGVINLNSPQSGALAAVLASTIRREDTPRVKIPGPAQSPSPSPLGATDATNAATALVSLTSTAPVKNKADLATLIANTNPAGFDATVPKTQRESMARALGETVQTRTWNLLIDIIAQSGRYPSNLTQNPNPADLPKFVVEGEQHYWVHVAIDRFTGQVLDKQIEVVTE
jgi:hypothetical protein